MKKIFGIVVLVFAITTSISCKKEKAAQTSTNTNTNTSATLPVGNIPASFTQKVLIEIFTGEWCGACPAGATEAKSIIAANPNNVYAAAIHFSITGGGTDPYDHPYFDVFREYVVAGSTFTGYSYGFPKGVVSRNSSISFYEKTVLNTVEDWKEVSNTVLAKTAKCGLAMVTTESNDKLNIDVYIGYHAPLTADAGELKLSLYLIENDLPSVKQSNAPPDYIHQHVLREVLTPNWGNKIDLTSSNRYTKVQFKNIDIKGKYANKNNLKVIAFVNQDAAKAEDYDILNVQEAGINEIKNWD